MKTTYQYITFVRIAEMTLTSVWSCRNIKSGDELGKVYWYFPWNQYIYFPTARESIYSDGCLEDMANFLRQLNESQKGMEP